MRILGIDPGIAIVGWGVIDFEGSRFRTVAYGAITTPSTDSVCQRLLTVDEQMNLLFEKYQPDVMSIEELFWNTNQTTGIIVAEARGVILTVATRRHIPVYEYTPLQVKQSVVGYGRADKKQVITMVTTFLHLEKPPKPDDTADALALAITHAHSGESRLAQFYNAPTVMKKRKN